MRKISQLIIGVSKVNEYSKGKEMGFYEQDLRYVATIKAKESISVKVLHPF
jgi:hypothetical protein